jgi:hypothetical protein
MTGEPPVTPADLFTRCLQLEAMQKSGNRINAIATTAGEGNGEATLAPEKATVDFQVASLTKEIAAIKAKYISLPAAIRGCYNGSLCTCRWKIALKMQWYWF